MSVLMRTALSALQTGERRLQAIGDNVANANTLGFKAARPELADVRVAVQGTDADGLAGVGLAGVTRSFERGPIVQTDEDLDLAIDGPGFFPVTLDDGTLAYTRAGAFEAAADGRLVTTAGYALAPAIQVPAGARSVQVAPNGAVVVEDGATGNQVVVGNVQLATFAAPDGLAQRGDNLYLATEQSGQAALGDPGTSGRGALIAGSLEGSNVLLQREMLDAMMAQRAYGIGARLAQIADEMMSHTNELKR